jgi:hypothetical protein
VLAVGLGQQVGLLINDALIVAVRQANALTKLPATTPTTTACRA